MGPAPDTVAASPRAQRADELRRRRHDAGAVPLVEPVVGRVEEQVGASRERLDEQGRPPRVERRVGVRHLRREHPARAARREPGRGDQHRRPQVGVHVEPDGTRPGPGRPALPRDGRAAEQRGRRVVRVALDRGREAERDVVVEDRRVGDERARRHDARDDGRGGRAEAPPVGDAVDARQVQTRLRRTRHVERGPQGPHHQVGLVAGHLSGALALDVDHDVVARERAHLEHVVEREREAQRVEAGAQVRARRGDAHPHVVRAELHQSSPRASAMDTTSAVTRVGSTSAPSSVRSAHCGSLSP